MSNLPKNKVRSLKRAVAFGAVYTGDAQQLSSAGFLAAPRGQPKHTPESKQKIREAVKRRHARARQQ